MYYILVASHNHHSIYYNMYSVVAIVSITNISTPRKLPAIRYI